LIRSSVAILSHIVADFDPPHLEGTLDAPDRLISDGYKVVELFAKAGTSAPQHEAMIAALTAALEKAEQSWTQAQAARVEVQRNQSVVREHALTLNKAMIALRRTLRTVMGTRHLDYQTLRVSRRSTAVEEEDESTVEEAATTESSSASASTEPTKGAATQSSYAA
jgi:hypothetical protein